MMEYAHVSKKYPLPTQTFNYISVVWTLLLYWSCEAFNMMFSVEGNLPTVLRTCVLEEMFIMPTVTKEILYGL